MPIVLAPEIASSCSKSSEGGSCCRHRGQGARGGTIEAASVLDAPTAWLPLGRGPCGPWAQRSSDERSEGTTPGSPTRTPAIQGCWKTCHLTSGCRRRWAGWEVLCRRDGRTPAAP